MPAPLIPADLLARTQIISGLRQLADYLQDHPGVPVNEYGWDLHAFATTDSDLAGRADVQQDRLCPRRPGPRRHRRRRPLHRFQDIRPDHLRVHPRHRPPPRRPPGADVLRRCHHHRRRHPRGRDSPEAA